MNPNKSVEQKAKHRRIQMISFLNKKGKANFIKNIVFRDICSIIKLLKASQRMVNFRFRIVATSGKEGVGVEGACGELELERYWGWASCYTGRVVKCLFF